MVCDSFSNYILHTKMFRSSFSLCGTRSQNEYRLSKIFVIIRIVGKSFAQIYYWSTIQWSWFGQNWLFGRCMQQNHKEKDFKIEKNVSISLILKQCRGCEKLAHGLWKPMTGVGVPFLLVWVFTQQLFKKAESKQPNPNWVEKHQLVTPVIGIYRPWASFSQPPYSTLNLYIHR